MERVRPRLLAAVAAVIGEGGTASAWERCIGCGEPAENPWRLGCIARSSGRRAGWHSVLAISRNALAKRKLSSRIVSRGLEGCGCPGRFSALVFGRRLRPKGTPGRSSHETRPFRSALVGRRLCCRASFHVARRASARACMRRRLRGPRRPVDGDRPVSPLRRLSSERSFRCCGAARSEETRHRRWPENVGRLITAPTSRLSPFVSSKL